MTDLASQLGHARTLQKKSLCYFLVEVDQLLTLWQVVANLGTEV